MKFFIKEAVYTEVDIENLSFPFYRYCSLNPHHATYCKFESKGKFTKIEEDGSQLIVQVFDQDKDLLKDVATLDMLRGTGMWAPIDESLFDTAFNRLVEQVGKI